VKVIGRDATGIDNVDLAARQLGIAVHAAHGANPPGAGLTEGLILGLVRTIPYSVGALKAEQWKRRKGIEALGRNLGLIGW
jgi:phosphoglycerate dehydrogenase-like enzyme